MKSCVINTTVLKYHRFRWLWPSVDMYDRFHELDQKDEDVDEGGQQLVQTSQPMHSGRPTWPMYHNDIVL